MTNGKYVLEARNISKIFPGVKALDHVTLRIRPGTVHALMGENGAGKSTLMNCIFGIYKMDEGELYLNEEKAGINSPADAMNNHLSMIHQELHPVRSQTVAENVFLGKIPYQKRFGIRWVDYQKLYAGTQKIFDDLGFHINPKQKVSELSTSYCQLLEIARAVSFNAKVIIMDEPTSSLTDDETELLFKSIEKLKKLGVAVIYISHKIDEILQISDEITVMRDGQVVGSWPANEMTSDKIVSTMVGRQMTKRFPLKRHIPGEVFMQVEHYTSFNSKSFKDINFEVRKGEIFGIGGLVGAQRSELVESIFGLRKISSGKLIINGKEVVITEPMDAVQNGMAFLTEERRATGILGSLNITDNTMVVQQNLCKKEYTKPNGFIDEMRRNDAASKYVKTLSIKTPSLKTKIQSLSGGNQQKVLLGRWLLTGPDILIMDEPTRGIDVGAKYEIYELMEDLANKGKCIIMISSEMPELMGMSDRIMVMCEGHQSGIVEGKHINDKEIMLLASTYKPGEQVTR